MRLKAIKWKQKEHMNIKHIEINVSACLWFVGLSGKFASQCLIIHWELRPNVTTDVTLIVAIAWVKKILEVNSAGSESRLCRLTGGLSCSCSAVGGAGSSRPLCTIGCAGSARSQSRLNSGKFFPSPTWTLPNVQMSFRKVSSSQSQVPFPSPQNSLF